jgi:hypothetical protein
MGLTQYDDEAQRKTLSFLISLRLMRNPLGIGYLSVYN